MFYDLRCFDLEGSVLERIKTSRGKKYAQNNNGTLSFTDSEKKDF